MDQITVENVSPLNQRQQVLLVDADFAPDARELTETWSFVLRGRVDEGVFAAAWEEVCKQHAVMCTTLVWKRVERPLQIVQRQVRIAVNHFDWRELTPGEQFAEFGKLVRSEEEQGFNFAQPPLVRLSLCRTDEDVYQVVCSYSLLLFDRRSIALLFAEALRTYAGDVVGGEGSELSHDRAYELRDSDYSSARDWWTQALADFRPATLTASRGMQEPESFYGEAELKLTHGLTADLARTAASLEVLFDTLLCSAWAIVLANYTREERVVFGVDAGETLPLPVEVESSITVSQWLKKQDAAWAQLSRLAPLPTALIRQWVELDANVRLFESRLVLPLLDESTSDEKTGLIVEQARAFALHETPLLIEIVSREPLTVRATYTTQLLDSTAAVRLLRHFEQALAAMVKCAEGSVEELGLLSEAEREQLREWNDTEREYGRERSIAAVFEEQVRERPEAIAVVIGEQSLTYAELNQRANQLGHYLRELGVGPEICVGLCVERSPEMIIGMLGILKAGGAYVPLDAGYPTERLAYMMRDAGVVVVLTQESLLEALPSHWGQVVSLDSEWEEIATRSIADVISEATGENLAYVMYTSGSTGEPKGTAIVQRAVVRLVKQTDYAQFGPAETFVQMAPLTFDASTFEVWGSLLNGGRLVVLEPGTPTLEDLGAALRRYDVSTLWLTAGLFHLVVDERPEELRGLKQLLAGGDVLSAGHVSKALQWLKHGCVINGYGPTENTTFSCCQRLERDTEIGATVPIGPPIANTEAHVLNARLQQTPVGVIGELYLGGDGLARGYQQRADLTATRFIPHPYSTRAGERLYRTGDLVRYQADGRLEFLGRVDNQVKVRGFRIEPGEIETVLTKHHAVRDAIVVARGGTSGDKQLVAYVVGAVDHDLTADKLRSHLKQHLPDYMTPSQIVFLDAFPLTANGKVDKSALPAPSAIADATAQEFVAPRTPVEIALAEVWQRVLGVDRVSIHDNYFDLGGDSIRSIQVRAQAQKAGYDFSVQQIFEHQTIAELAPEAVRIDGRATETLQVAAFDLITPEDRARIPREIEDAYPLSLLQRGMLFHSELNQQLAIYHDIIGFHVRLPLDRVALETAIAEVVARHSVLRTSFDLEHYSEPLQLVHRTVKPQLSFIDQRHLSATERKQFVTDWIEEDKRRPFEWTQPALIRFTIFSYSDNEFHINFSFHHAIIDGWSLNLLITEIFSRYLSLRDGTTQTSDAPLSVAFRDFIALERQALQSEAVKNYWSEKLANLPVTTLPTREGAAPAAANRKVVQLAFGSELVGQLKSFAKLARVPLKSVFVAAHMKILGLLSRQHDVTTGLVSNCRPEEADGDRVVGVFLNTLPLTISTREQMWLELAQAAAEAEQELSLYRRYPLAALQREYGTQPLFETTFNFNHFHILQDLRDNSMLEIVDTNSFTRTNFALSVGFDLNSITSELVLFLEYDVARFSRAQAEAIGNYFSLTLQAMVRDPFAAINNTYLLTESEQQTLLTLNDTSEDYPRQVCLHELIEAQAERTPHAIALLSESEKLSYRDLNARANQLAHHLREHGVGPESLVGVLLERSNDLIAALLAVLKAGGAYVPLDPAYPRDRLQLMIEDAGIGVLLTERKLHDRLPPHNAEVISLDDTSTHAALSSASTANPNHLSDPEGLIYLLYTSGSTGVPKGVLVTHHSIVNCIDWMQRIYNLNPSDRFLFKTSLNFDASVWEVFWPLTIGAAVVVARPASEKDGPYLTETMRTEAVTCAYFVPSMLALWLETSGLDQLLPLRYVICGGEALSGQLLTNYFDRFGEKVELHHSYGPTETSIASAESVCSPSYRTWRRMPIGRALANTKLYVVDTTLQLVPLGIAGELYIGGDGVARGYHDRPELTATAFIPDPFSNEPGARLYRTGDLVRYLHDGQLEFLGRVDDQVKLRGVRFELGEIEATLRQHPAVREAVALVREFAAGDHRLVVYVVADGAVDQAALREYVRGKLPEYLVPSAFVLLEKLPLLPSGKINKRALPAPEITRHEVSESYVAPRTAMEEMIANIWSELLGVKRVGVYDNFFELGGHSLLAAQIVVRVRHKFAVNVPLQSLFDTPNVAGLALAVMQSQAQMLDLTETENLLAELEALSEEEAQSLVAGQGSPS